MMNFFALLAVLVGISVVMADKAAPVQKGTPKQLLEMVQSTSAKYSPYPKAENVKKSSNLRTESVQSGSGGATFKVHGYAETVAYGHKDCSHANWKDNTLLNTCAWSDRYLFYIRMSAMADPTNHNYYNSLNAFTTSDCSGSPMWSLPTTTKILICDAYKNLYHAIPYALDPMTDNLQGFALGVFKTQQSCQNPQRAASLLESTYQRLNRCVPSWDNSNTATFNGDFMYTSCTPEMITYTVYSSTDGTCTGTMTNYQITTSDMCANPNYSLEVYSGYLTWICESTM
jgi:hypothetical protein